MDEELTITNDQAEGVDAEVTQSEPQAQAPQQSDGIEYNGKRYTAREIDELERAAMRQDDYTRKTQALAAEKAEIERLRAEIEKQKSIKPESSNPEQDFLRQQEKELLRKQYGVVTKEDLEEELKKIQEGYKKEFETREMSQLQEKAQVELDKAIKSLSTKYDGLDGKPKFEFEQARQFLLDNGIGGKSINSYEKDLENAYFLMNRENFYKPVQKKVAGAPTLPGQAVKENLKGTEIKNLKEASKAASQLFKEAGFE